MTTIATPQQTAGPLFAFALMYNGSEQAVDPADPDAMIVEGRITDGGGLPLQWEAEVELWEGDQFARTRTMDDGLFSALIRRPAPGVAPDGSALAPFVHVTIFGRGINRRLDTRMYLPDEAQANAADPVLNLAPEDRRGSLIARPTNDPRRVRFDIVLQGEAETVFFDY